MPPRTLPADSISVVIPTVGRPEFLRSAVGSVLRQTRLPHEILIVADAPSSGAPVEFDVPESVTLHRLQHDRPRGASAARNTGLAQAAADFVAFLDDDDRWEPSKLEKQLACFRQARKPIAGVFCYSDQWSPLDPGRRLESLTPRLELEFDDFLEKTYFGTSIPLLKRTDLLEIGGFDEALVSVQDRDLWLRLARHKPFVGVGEVLAHRAIHGAQISTSLDLKIRGREQFMEKYAGDLDAHPGVLCGHHWKLGLMYGALEDFEQAKRHLRNAIRVDESNPGPVQDLHQLQHDPGLHAERIRKDRFNRVGDAVLYY